MNKDIRQLAGDAEKTALNTNKVTRRDFIKKTILTTALTIGATSILNVPKDSFAKKISLKPVKIKTNYVKTINGKEVKWITNPSAEEKLLIPKISLPLIAQDGAMVPIKMETKKPQTNSLYLKTFYICDLNNPHLILGSFDLTPLNGKAYIATRIKLLQESYVQVLAEYSNNEVYGARKLVKVTVGGC
jgi:sulfur-oxidizing protein SoxY